MWGGGALVSFAHPNLGAQTMSEHVEATRESRDGWATFVVTERIRPTHVQAFEDWVKKANTQLLGAGRFPEY